MAWKLITELETLMMYNISVLDEPLVETADVLGLVDEHKLHQAIDTSRKVFEALTGASVSGTNGNFDRYFYRENGCNRAAILENVPRHREKLSPFAKSFAEFLDSARLTVQATKDHRWNLIQKENLDGTLQRVRELPDRYRNFRENAALKLAQTC